MLFVKLYIRGMGYERPSCTFVDAVGVVLLIRWMLLNESIIRGREKKRKVEGVVLALIVAGW